MRILPGSETDSCTPNEHNVHRDTQDPAFFGKVISGDQRSRDKLTSHRRTVDGCAPTARMFLPEH